MASYYTERAAILPSGEVIEEGVKSLEGIIGKDRKGSYTTEYTEYGI